MDSVVGRIIELEFDSAEVYLGNYSYYLVEKERRFIVEYKNYQNQQKKIERMERQIERYRIWGAMRDSDKMYRRAKELEKRLEKIDVLDPPILEKRKIRLDQNQIDRSGKIVLETRGLSKSFDEKKLFQNVDIDIRYQDSACIIGKNGCGKSTLLKIILGELEADQGRIRIGSQVKIGYLPQYVVFEDEEQTVLEYFSRLHDITMGEARSQLAKVLFFKEDVNKKIKFLSGGEKSRLRLCSLTFDNVNFMILDEPTNHLDIDSREVLEENLCNFEGTLLFVSHDRYFINKVTDKMIVLDNHEAKIYPGDYSYYLNEYHKEQEKLVVSSSEESKKEIKKSTAPKTQEKLGNKVNQERKLEQIEKEIEVIEEEIKGLGIQMELHGSDVERLQDIFQEKEKLEENLEKAYEEWDNITSKLGES